MRMGMGSIPLDYQEALYSASFSGPFLAAQVISVILRKIGNFIHLEIPAVTSGAAAGTITSATATAIIPAGLRPSVSIYRVTSILVNSVLLNVPGKVEVKSTGDIKIWCDLLETGLFTAIGNNGWQRVSIQYAL